MQITKKISYDVTGKAVYREGKLSVSVIVAAAYGDRKASIVIDKFPKKFLDALKGVFKEMIEEAIPVAIPLADLAAMRALDVATRYRENVVVVEEEPANDSG